MTGITEQALGGTVRPLAERLRRQARGGAS